MSTRTQNTKRNIVASYGLMVVQMLFQFISRTLIVNVLGEEYLGLSSLFASILTVLNITDLGFTASIVFFMYKPLSDGDEDKVCALLAYLRKIYKIVGSVILFVGLSILPLIPKIIKGDIPQSVNIYILYCLYLVNTAISYFLFAHKTALLTAIQRLDLTKMANTVIIVVQYVLQVIALIYFRNYYLFVGAMIIGSALLNIFTAYICKRKYPQYECRGELDNETKQNIIIKVKGLLICNISIVTYKTLDSIVISHFIGLASVAIYSNYITIYNTVNSMVVMIRSSMQSSVGDSVASESVEKNLKDMKLWQFLFSIMATWCMACLICLYQPFMKVWMGNNMLLPFVDVILIGIWFFIDVVQQAYYMYLSGTGLWNEMKYSYIFNTCCNLVMNIFLGKVFGITGIIMASLITCIISGTFWQCILLFKHYYRQSAKKYIVTQFLYFCTAGVIVGIAYNFCSFVTLDGLSEFFVKALICSIVTMLLLFVFYRKNIHYAESKALFERIIKRR